MNKKVIRTRNLKLKKTKAKNFFSKFFAWLLILIVLGGVGFYATEYFSNNINIIDNSTSSSKIDESSSSATNDNSLLEQSSSIIEEDSTSSTIINIDKTKSKSITMSLKTAQKESLYKSFITKAKKDGYTSIVVLLKDTNGNINYKSDVELANKCGAVITNPINLTTLCNEILKNGLTPVAIMSTLKDPKAAHVNYNTSYKYSNTEYTWFDDAPESGGKPWLNPYLPNTVNYLKELTVEMAENGCKEIILTDMNLPTQYISNLNYVNKTMSEDLIFNKVIKDIEKAVLVKNATLSFNNDIVNLFVNKKIYADKPFNVISDVTYSPLISLKSLSTNLKQLPKNVKSLNINNDTEEIVGNLLKYVSTKLSPNTKIVPIILENEKETLIPILDSLGFFSYIIK